MSAKMTIAKLIKMMRRWAVNDLSVSILSTLLINGRFSTLYFIPLVKTSTAVSCDCACLMSPNKNETGRRLSQMLLFLVVR